MRTPSGDQTGGPSSPGCPVSRSAFPPPAGTSQTSHPVPGPGSGSSPGARLPRKAIRSPAASTAGSRATRSGSVRGSGSPPSSSRKRRPVSSSSPRGRRPETKTTDMVSPTNRGAESQRRPSVSTPGRAPAAVRKRVERFRVAAASTTRRPSADTPKPSAWGRPRAVSRASAWAGSMSCPGCPAGTAVPGPGARNSDAAIPARPARRIAEGRIREA